MGDLWIPHRVVKGTCGPEVGGSVLYDLCGVNIDWICSLPRLGNSTTGPSPSFAFGPANTDVWRRIHPKIRLRQMNGRMGFLFRLSVIKRKPMRPFICLSLILGWILLQTSVFAGPKAKDGDGPVVELPSLGNEHIQSMFTPHKSYSTDPPTSGPHVPFTTRWGIHKSPIPKEIQTHNLEDGGVIIQY